ncbi:putative ATP binding [Lyophyllum shimeji]|uniref:ATP binding n=1 Tax=Lyophyllum shimeji TaxID=47721 RepID=A0A9P3PME1_LYOSH|nr:putative ATP binding [Lyophyllum shimeji]
MVTRTPYNGPRRKLVLALDVGTTFSGISFCILEPGQVPVIKGVTRFPAQEQVGGDSKIPTIIYYDQYGVVRAAGAEALKEGLEDMIEDEGWTKAEWFKLHLRPKSAANACAVMQKLSPLPRNMTVVDVFADFLRYLNKCAQTFIRETHANGDLLWKSVEKHIEFVLPHPNGWEGAQQAQLRNAAVRAGLVPDSNEGRSRVHFVTEGEASLHFCIQRGLTTEAMKNGDGILIVDAGGGTIDISAYGQTSTSAGLSFQEVAPAQCYFEGSIFVTNYARAFLSNLLKDSQFYDDVDYIARCFDKTTKLRFRNSGESQFIKFGSARDKDPGLGIRSGQLRLKGTDVAKFFKPSISCIIKCILEQRRSASKTISTVFLVGGFAASDWLLTQLKNSLEPKGINFSRPDGHVNKAVADGGVSFYIDHFVTARVAKFACGVDCSIPYIPADFEHRQRYHAMWRDAAGIDRIPSAFDTILPKDTQVEERTEFRRSYDYTRKAHGDLPNQISVDVLCYRGCSANPRWTDQETEMYTPLCTVVADTRQFKTTLGTPRPAADGSGWYYQMSFDVILNFGLTELTAQLCWEEDGMEIRSPAEVIYDCAL